MTKEALESCRRDQFFGGRYLLLQILYLTQSPSLLFSCVILDVDMSSPTPPRVDPLAWEEETAEERVQPRAQHLHLANDQDPKNKSIAQ